PPAPRAGRVRSRLQGDRRLQCRARAGSALEPRPAQFRTRLLDRDPDLPRDPRIHRPRAGLQRDLRLAPGRQGSPGQRPDARPHQPQRQAEDLRLPQRTGTRHPHTAMTPQKLVILGGTGFVGRHLVSRLAREGHRIVLLSRNIALHSDRLLPPGVDLRELDVYDPTALQQAFAGADAVINLVGILNERGDNGRGFRRAHVELSKLVIAAMKLAGVRRLLQMSALNAGRGQSHYLKSRGEAEAAVKASGLDWTIFEPSVIFGPGDGLFCRFATLLRLAPVLPLARAGARFAPVYVGDVVEACRRALHDRRTFGEVYELYGPDVFTLREIVRMTAR